MNKLILYAVAATAFAASCGTPKPEGMKEVKTPFSGSRYESNGTWFRASGSGESLNLETSRDKAALAAKQRLASEIQTQIKAVNENYKGERQAGNITGDFNERFQSLTREVLNQILVEVQKVDEKTFSGKNNHYLTYVALESRKKTVYKKLEEIAKTRQSLSDKDKEYIQQILEKAINDLHDSN